MQCSKRSRVVLQCFLDGLLVHRRLLRSILSGCPRNSPVLISGLKMGAENGMFQSEIESGFGGPGGTPLQKFWGVPPPSGLHRNIIQWQKPVLKSTRQTHYKPLGHRDQKCKNKPFSREMRTRPYSRGTEILHCHPSIYRQLSPLSHAPCHRPSSTVQLFLWREQIFNSKKCQLTHTVLILTRVFAR